MMDVNDVILNGAKIYLCHICEKEYYMHDWQCVTSRIIHFGRIDVCDDCLIKKIIGGGAEK